MATEFLVPQPCTHEHCALCVQISCKYNKFVPVATADNSCPVTHCGLLCGAAYHMCKESEHRELCANECVSCINATNGCTAVMPRWTRGKHLSHCPASVVFCTMEWNRWPVFSRERQARVPFSQTNLHARIGQLDVALALRDQRVLSEGMKAPHSMRRALRNRLTERFPAVPLSLKRSPYTENSTQVVADGRGDSVAMGDGSTHQLHRCGSGDRRSTSMDTISDDDASYSDVPWMASKDPPGLRRSIVQRLFTGSTIVADRSKSEESNRVAVDPSPSLSSVHCSSKLEAIFFDELDEQNLCLTNDVSEIISTSRRIEDINSADHGAISVEVINTMQCDNSLQNLCDNCVSKVCPDDTVGRDMISGDNDCCIHQEVMCYNSEKEADKIRMPNYNKSSREVGEDPSHGSSSDNSVQIISCKECHCGLINASHTVHADYCSSSECCCNSSHDCHVSPMQAVSSPTKLANKLLSIDNHAVNCENLEFSKQSKTCSTSVTEPSLVYNFPAEVFARLKESACYDMKANCKVHEHKDDLTKDTCTIQGSFEIPGASATGSKKVHADTCSVDNGFAAMCCSQPHSCVPHESTKLEIVNEHRLINSDIMDNGNMVIESSNNINAVDKTMFDAFRKCTDLSNGASCTASSDINVSVPSHSGSVNSSHSLEPDSSSYVSTQSNPSWIRACSQSDTTAPFLLNSASLISGSSHPITSSSIPPVPPPLFLPPYPHPLPPSASPLPLALQHILALDLNIESITRYQAKPKSMYTFLCAQPFRRDEFASHFRNIHTDIHSSLNGWLEARCPLAHYGCTFSVQRLHPLGGTIVFSSVLDSFGFKPTPPVVGSSSLTTSAAAHEAFESSGNTSAFNSRISHEIIDVKLSTKPISKLQISAEVTQNKIGIDECTSELGVTATYETEASIDNTCNEKQDLTQNTVDSHNVKEPTPEIFTSKDYDSAIKIIAGVETQPLRHNTDQSKQSGSSSGQGDCVGANPGHEVGDVFSLLPFEILQHIARCLDSFSLCNLALTSFYMRDVCRSIVEEKGIVIQEWERRNAVGKSSHWVIAYQRWLFSSSISPIDHWYISQTSSISKHLKTCQFYVCAEPSNHPIRLPSMVQDADAAHNALRRMYGDDVSFDYFGSDGPSLGDLNNMDEMEGMLRGCRRESETCRRLFNAHICANGLTEYQTRLRKFAQVVTQRRDPLVAGSEDSSISNDKDDGDLQELEMHNREELEHGVINHVGEGIECVGEDVKVLEHVLKYVVVTEHVGEDVVIEHVGQDSAIIENAGESAEDIDQHILGIVAAGMAQNIQGENAANLVVAHNDPAADS